MFGLSLLYLINHLKLYFDYWKLQKTPKPLKVYYTWKYTTTHLKSITAITSELPQSCLLLSTKLSTLLSLPISAWSPLCDYQQCYYKSSAYSTRSATQSCSLKGLQSSSAQACICAQSTSTFPFCIIIIHGIGCSLSTRPGNHSVILRTAPLCKKTSPFTCPKQRSH